MHAGSASAGQKTFPTAALAAIAVLTILGWWFFPGHTFLHSDTQIYLPILERLHDPSLYPNDPVALRPHVSYTIYDEMALFLRWLTRLDFEWVLYAQQLLCRACGLLGVFLIARAFQLSTALSLLAASVYGLGAVVNGPAVLTLEYEPVPRGFAGPLVMLAVGMAAYSLWRWAGIVCGIAILYHPTTTVPFCVAVALLALWNRDARRALSPMFLAAAVLFVLSRLQAGAGESQEFFGGIPAELEKLQRLRGPYVWISMWGAQWIRHYEFLGLVCVAVWLRLRASSGAPFQFLLLGIPVYGLLSMPLNYLLLEQLKWSLMPAFQPARAVMFVAALAAIGSAVAGLKAAREARIWESIPWLMIAFAIPAQAEVLQLLLPDPRDPLVRVRWLIVAGLAVVAAIAARWESRRPRWTLAACALAMLLPFWLIPGPAGVRSHPSLDEPELHQLGQWARENTATSAVFLFPEHGRGLQPGFFRVYALRSLYVDWKGGGQVNLLREFALDWWDRWRKAMESKFDPARAGEFRSMGIDYLVLKPGTNPGASNVVYRNSKYVVHSLR